MDSPTLSAKMWQKCSNIPIHLKCYKSKMARKTGRKPVLKSCSNCGVAFLYAGSHATRNKNFFCCYECYIKYKTKKVNVRCDNCGRNFEKKQSDIRRTDHNFCSPKCNLEYRHREGERAWNHCVNGEILHRKVAEEKIGRKLKSGEEVHHIDGNHFNNDPDNLIVLSKSDHAKIHASWKARSENGQFVKSSPAS